MPALSGIVNVGGLGVGVPCPCHRFPLPYITIFVTGSQNVTIEGSSACHTGTLGIATCGHITVALSASPNITIDGISAHRVGDIGMNCSPYVAVAGASSTKGV